MNMRRNYFTVGFSVALTSSSLSRVDPSGLSSIVAILVISSTQPTSELLHSLRFICVCGHISASVYNIFTSSPQHGSTRVFQAIHCTVSPTRLASGTQPLCHRAGVYHNIHHTIGSSSLPSLKNKMLHAAYGADLKNENSRSGRIQSVPSPPVDGQSPSSFAVESSLLPAQFPPRKPRLHRSVARGGVSLRARTFRLSIAAPPLLPKKTRES